VHSSTSSGLNKLGATIHVEESVFFLKDDMGDTQLEVQSPEERLKEKIKLLLIDNDPQFLDLTVRSLEKEDSNIEIEKCETPKKALKLLEEEDFDGILSDYDMPEMDGLELLKRVRLRWPDMPFIMVTGAGDEEVASEAMRLGVDDYFKKKGITDELSIIVNRIENVIALKQTEKEREEALARLQESQEKYELLLANLPDGAAAMFDKGLAYTLVGGEIIKVAGLEPEDLRGEHISAIYDDEDLDRIRENYKATLRGEKRRFKAKLQGRTLSVVTSPVKEDGEIVAGLALSYDITDLQEEDLKEFGNLLSHDLRNPLDIAKGYLDLMERPESENEELLEEAKNAVYRAIKVAEDLKIIAVTPEDIEEEEVNLEDAFTQALTSIKVSPESYNIEDTTIAARNGSITRLFANLIQNSVEHNPEPVSIKVGSLGNGFYYEDNGKGIPENNREKIMKKGFTTSGEGQGLGLYIINRIAELHSWEVNVTDAENGGARLEFYLEEETT
jgi:PAS domain S-box-containing protein